MPSQKRTIDGVELAYRISGEGRPIVLIHGLAANMRDWSLTVKPLAEAGWRVLTPETPGHGDSAAPPDREAYGMASVADRLHGLAVALGFAPAVIVGHSMGGAIAEEYAARHGGDVAALVLVASAGGAPRPYVRTPQMDAFAAEERATVLEHGMQAAWDLHQARGTWASVQHMPPAVQAFFRARFLRCAPLGYAYGDDALQGRRDTTDDLRRFDKPALVICGAHEEPLMRGTSAALAAALPRARLVEIANAGHGLQYENAAAFNAALLAFLRTV
jgi:pimeloyl-ACP methyl ester carboxylesterase